MQLLSFATLCLAAPVGYAGLCIARRDVRATEPVAAQSPKGSSARASEVAGGRRRAALWAVASLSVLAAPWGLPDIPVLRFFVAVCAVLAFMRLTETWLGRGFGASTQQFAEYFWYFTFFGEVRPNPANERNLGRKQGLLRVLRGSAKAVCVVGLVAVSTAWPWLWNSFVLRSLWCLLAGYFGATGAADVVSGLQMLVSGHGCAETFVLPPLARSPGDFWGRRWNLVFRNVSHRVLFQRVARSRGVFAAGAAVFLWSIVAHEYLVVATLGYTRGDMALFFGLQGALTLLLSRIRRGQPWPTFVAVGAHWAWMITTAPLFFLPVLRIFPADQWRLW